MIPRGMRLATGSRSRGSNEPPAHKPLATDSPSRGSNEPPAHDPLATGSKTKTMTKTKKKEKTEKKHATDSDVDVPSTKCGALSKAKPRPPSVVPATGGIARDHDHDSQQDQREAKTKKRAIIKVPLSPSSDLDSMRSNSKRRRPTFAGLWRR